MPQMGSTGTQYITNQTDVAIGTSGKPIRVFDINVVSGGTAAVVKLYNGTSATGSFIQINGTINIGVSVNSLAGFLFPLGCFADVDANTTSLAVNFAQEI